MQYHFDFFNIHAEVQIDMIADRIRFLRENGNITQTELAKQLGITRSSVNAWEQGISIPSTQYLIELARIFHISADYILEIDATSTMDISGLEDEDIQLLYQIAEHLRKRHTSF